MAPAAGTDEGLPQLPGAVLTPWAVLFDLDGTLVDTEPVLHDALLAVLGAHGVPPGRIRPEDLRGHGVAENLARLARLVTPPLDTRRLYAAVGGRTLERLRAGVAPLPGAAGLLGALRRAGVPCALVTSSYRETVDAVLPSLGAAEFAVTLAGDEVRRPKPDPEPYRTAAARLGVPPGRCVVVEDSAPGLASGRAAGCVTVAVAPSQEPADLTAVAPSTEPADLTAVAPAPGPADLTVRSLSELTVERLAFLAGAGPSPAGGAGPRRSPRPAEESGVPT